MLKTQDQRGVVSMGEYVVTFFLVITVVVAMTVYVQRSLQARMRDARHNMILAVSNECKEDCMRATHLEGNTQIGEQYEPYYVKANSTVTTDSLSHSGLLSPGIGSTGIFIERTSSKQLIGTQSNQMPPKDSAGDKVLGNR